MFSSRNIQKSISSKETKHTNFYMTSILCNGQKTQHNMVPQQPGNKKNCPANLNI
jgi:hypothetical protein